MKRKNIFKSLLAAAMALIMIFGAAPLSGFVGIRLPMLSLKAEAATTEDGLFEYEVKENGTGSEYQCGVRITRYKGPDSGEVVIPKTIEGYEVKWIGYPWQDKVFQGYTGITSIVIPDSVTSIGSSAFSGCKSLAEIDIPDSVTEIGNSAFGYCTSLSKVKLSKNLTGIGSGVFSGCTSLAEITIPDSVTSIGEWAFSGCTSLTEITIPDSVTSIGDSAFHDCENLTEITIPDSVTEIGNYAFYNCISLSKVKLPNGLTKIGYSAFRGCINLTDITISSDNKNFSSVDGVLFSKDMSTLLVYPAGSKRSTYIVPDSVTEIGDYTFYYCKNLREITIPDSVTEIGYQAFSGCTSLTEIVIPDSVTEIGSFAFSGCTSLSKVQLPNGLTKIGDSAFYYCTSLTEITIPDSVTQIEVSAFSGCTSLKELTIPDSVISIGGYAFSGCTSLAKITVSPDNKNYSSVDGVLFSKDMSALLAYPAGNKRSTYTVPDSVTKIDDAAFFGCVYLTDITVSSDNKNYVSVDGVLFTKNMSTLVAYPAGNERSTYTIPYGVKKICGLAYCENLKEIVFPDSVIDASSELLVGCCSLTNIVVSPGNNIFWSADGVLFANIEVNFLITYPAAKERSTYTIPDGVEIIYAEAFAHSKNLKSVTISESVTAIYEAAFMCCTNLREITIPKSVIEIDDSAFENCDSLKNVYYLGTRAQWKAVVIGTKNEALTRATVHCIDDPPCDHVWGEWEVVEEATYEKEGLERRACSRCNIEETRVIPKLVRASAIELSESEKTVFVGDTFTITATVKPEDAFNRTVTWSSSDPSIATVDENGTVTAIAKGEAIITAESADGVTAECKVTVEKKDGFFKTLLKIITAPFRAIIYLFKKLFGK